MLKSFLSTVFIILITVSCVKDKTYQIDTDKDGITVITNFKPASPEIKLELVELTSIDFNTIAENGELSGLKNISSVTIDQNNNLFVADFRTCKIFKFDQKGSFVKSFSQRGEGPGENIVVFHIQAIKDTLFVYGANSKVSKFDFNGNFISQDMVLNGKYLLSNLIEHQNNRFLFYNSNIIYDPNGIDVYTDLSVNLIDNTIHNQPTELFYKRYKEKMSRHELNMSRSMTSVAFGENRFYVEDMSKDVYSVSVFDYNGKLIEKIKKQTRRIPLSLRDKKKIDSLNVIQVGRINLVGDFKRQIESLMTDKYKNLWIKPAIENVEFSKHNNYDIFNKEGIYLSRISLPYKEWFVLKFVSDKIVLFNNDKMILKVYNYILE